jgi:hypothetical protein
LPFDPEASTVIRIMLFSIRRPPLCRRGIHGIDVPTPARHYPLPPVPYSLLFGLVGARKFTVERITTWSRWLYASVRVRTTP